MEPISSFGLDVTFVDDGIILPDNTRFNLLGGWTIETLIWSDTLQTGDILAHTVGGRHQFS